MLAYYEAELNESKRPHLTLAKIFRDVVGRAISPALVVKLLKSYDRELILEAILAMEDRRVDKPANYLFGICKNMAAARVPEPKSLDATIDMFSNERNRKDRPILRSPFEDVTT